jgi:hypothetical protein
MWKCEKFIEIKRKSKESLFKRKESHLLKIFPSESIVEIIRLYKKKNLAT